DRADPVLDPLPLPLHQRRRKPDVELPRSHAERERRAEVAELVHEDEHTQPDDRDEEAHAATNLRAAIARACSSAATSSSSVHAATPSTWPRVSSTVPAMSRKPMRPSRNAATAPSLAAL